MSEITVDKQTLSCIAEVIADKVIDKLNNDKDKNKWHDLRKDPNDLPKEDGIYLCYIVNEPYKYYMTCTRFDTNWFPDCETASNKVVAWREIEPLEEVSE